MSSYGYEKRFRDMEDYLHRNPKASLDRYFMAELDDVRRLAQQEQQMARDHLQGLARSPWPSAAEMEQRFFGLDLAAAKKPPPPEPLAPASTVFGEILAWRVWKVKAGWLRSTYREDIWPASGPIIASGIEDHNAIGIHAWKDQQQAIKYGMEYSAGWVVLGKVRLWGTVIEHERGYRAEFARVAEITDCYHGTRVWPTEFANETLLAVLRRRYLPEGAKAQAKPQAEAK